MFSNTCFLTLLALAPLSAARAQTCAVPAPTDHEMHPVWSGETWATFSDGDGSSLRIWTGEDGGRIRWSHDAGATWEFADTPDDFTGSIFDLWFFPGGEHGFATGRGGHVLETFDGGQTWTYYGAQIFDGANNPATLWGVRSLGDGMVLASGLWAFSYTVNYGTTWTSISLYDRDPSLPGATLIPFSDLEIFRLDIVGTASGFVGCVGAEWVEPGVGGHGVVFFTDSTLSKSSAGRKWWIVLDDADTLSSDPLIDPVMLEPWAVRYERGSTNTATSVAYVCGGPGGNHWSRHYRSQDAGRTWTLGGEVPVTPYDVTSQIGGTAMIVAYSGQYFLRDPVTGVWSPHVMSGGSGWQPTAGQLTAALEGASSFGAEGFIATGDFGTQRISTTLPPSWTSMSDLYPTSEELEQRIYDCEFLPSAPLTGCVVGQFGRIMRTTDGGCSFQVATPVFNAPGLNGVDFGTASFGVAVGEAGSRLHSTDGGQSWTSGAFAVGTTFPSGYTAADIAFRGVSTPANAVAWAVGSFPDGSPAVAYTRTSGGTWFLMTPPVSSNLKLEAVDFADVNGGLVVGHSSAGGSNRTARAFAAAFNGVTLTWTDVSPSLSGASTRLMDVAVSGSPLALATAVAVGDDGLVLEWTGTGFTEVTPTLTPVNLTSVDVSPSGATVLVGGKYDFDLSTADDKGFLLRRVSGVWGTLRALTGKDITGISLTGDTAGYVAGQTGDDDSPSFINGNLASSILLRYVAN